MNKILSLTILSLIIIIIISPIIYLNFYLKNNSENKNLDNKLIEIKLNNNISLNNNSNSNNISLNSNSNNISLNNNSNNNISLNNNSNNNISLNNNSNNNISLNNNSNSNNISLNNNSSNNNISLNNNLIYMRGEIASNAVNNLSWVSKFNIVEMSDIAEKNELVELMKKYNIKVYAYDWMPADYHYTKSNSDKDFMKWILKDKKSRTLNPNGPFPHCLNNNYDWCEDYYYNFANDEVLNKRVEEVKSEIIKNNYSGVFFDWANFYLRDTGDYASMKKDWDKKYNFTYTSRIKKYYSSLKNNNISIFTNQAFRADGDLIGFVDYDMTESYMTSYLKTDKKIKLNSNNEDYLYLTKYFSLRVNEFKSNYSLDTLFEHTMYYLNLLQKKKKEYVTNKNFKYVYMNYAAPNYNVSNNIYTKIQPKNAIFYNYALAKIVNEFEYTEIPNANYLEYSNIYFYYLGVPYGENYINYSNSPNNRIYLRYYNNSIIVVGFINETKSINLESNYIRKDSELYDIYNNKWLQTNNNQLDLNISPEYDKNLKEFVPFGRIYVYSN